MALTLADKQELSDLLIRYGFAVDGETTVDEFVSLFTDDAVLDGPAGHREGRADVTKFAEARAAITDHKTRHLITNIVVDEDDAGEARIRAYFLEYFTLLELVPPRHIRTSDLLYVGTYDCRARQVDGVWRMSNRTVTVDAP